VGSFSIGDADFLLDGRPHRVLAGAIHYFRVHPDQWADRIHKARLMGLNTIETYVAWNAHEPRLGEWNASGALDLARFLDLVAAEGMHAIVRPGPYICAEWHNGGLPVWLTSAPGIRLRESDPEYIAHLGRHLERVYEIVAPRQIDRGGPVVLVQIENEYGAYGSDASYLTELVRITRDAGITVPLTTVDQPHPEMLAAGSLPELHRTGSFGSQIAERLATLREFQPTGPLMCSEFWDGWFDWWGGAHHTTSAETAAAHLDQLLAAGASANIYMFHGGTNFGLTNGANHRGRYLPIVTSYDYDAPLDEAGEPTEKYWALRAVIARYADVPDEVPARSGPAPAFTAELVKAVEGLAGTAQAATVHTAPPTFEDLAFLGALVEYETDLSDGAFPGGRPGVLAFDEVRDVAWVRMDGVLVGTLSRTRQERRIVVPAGRRLTLLVEEQGRVNYDSRLGEAKGIIGEVRLGDVPLEGWRAATVDLDQWADAAIRAAGAPADASQAGPVALRGEFALDRQSDLFLDTDAWSKGYAFVNGFFLGRYWRNGPQRTLYVPAPVTRAGDNVLVVLELESAAGPARFVPAPLLGHRDE
jgi:beta-galactosidase